MSVQFITAELRHWILEQVQAGHSPEQVLAAMKTSGWGENLALQALDETLNSPVPEKKAAPQDINGLPSPVRVPTPALAGSTPTLWAGDREVKVLLTLHPRGAEAWYDSTIDTIYATNRMWQFKVLEFATPFGRKFGDMSRKLIWQRSHKGTMENHEQAIAHYHQHIAEVKAAVPPERLLVFSADQGWQPLCDFLGVPVPDTPFPNVNDRAAIKKTLRQMSSGAYVILAAAALACAGLVYAAVCLLN